MQYQPGDSVYISVVHQTYTLATDTWAEADPDTGYPKITIIDPSGTTKVDAQTMTQRATGKFDYSYELPTSPTAGWWRGYVDVANAGAPDRQYFGFRVTG